MSFSSALLRWLPRDARAGVRRRMGIVWAVALAIALLQWSLGGSDLDSALVYSLAISTAIWFCTDPLRIACHRWFGAEAPHYWASNGRIRGFMFAAVVLGYAVGTGVGDAYSGRATWALWALAPQRFWGFFIGSMAISAGFLFYFSQREKTAELQRQASAARLLLLESQLEPHMLFNTLANLRALIATDPPRAIAMLDRLNAFLRATLRATRDTGQAHTLALEFARLADYLELMAVRMGPRLRHELHLPPALAGLPLPALLLQPLVENAIRHGLEPKLEGGVLRVSAQAVNGCLHLTVADSGVGFEPQSGTGASGFGLAQVRERVAGAGGEITITAAPGAGATFAITLPLPAGFQP